MVMKNVLKMAELRTFHEIPRVTEMTNSIHLQVFEDDVYLFQIFGSPDVDMCEKELITPLNALLERSTPFSLILNGGDIKDVSVAATWRIIKWMRSNHDAIKTNLLSTSVVLKNSNVRHAIEFIFSVQPPVSPVRFDETIRDAWSFVFLNKKKRNES
jgi:hypothetical protein